MGANAFGTAYASINNVEAVTEAQSNKTLNIKKSEGSEASEGNNDEITIDNIRYKRYNGIGKVGNTRLYTGREYDKEIGLYYFRARYYSPDTGRFINRDPIDIADDVNLYAYVGNNGVMFVDPSGEVKQFIYNGYDFVTEITGLKTLGEGLGYTTLFWNGYFTGNDDIRNAGINGLNSVKNDVYLIAASYATFKVGDKLYKIYKSSKLTSYSMKLELSKIGSPLKVLNKNGTISIGGKLKGEFDFIVKNNKIITGISHSFLANGKNVNYAGVIGISNGKVSFWKNISGHYQPKSSDIEGIKKTILLFEKQYGIKLKNFIPFDY